MEVIVKKITAGTDTTLFVGKGINNPRTASIQRLTLNRIVLTGLLDDGDVAITLSAEDVKDQSVKSITICNGAKVYSGTINTILDSNMYFTDAYSIVVNCSAAATIYFEYSIMSDTKFVSAFKSNNE